jgi:hypothetical protein
MYFWMSTPALAATICAIVGGAATFGFLIGRRLHSRGTAHREPVGVAQGTLLGLVGLLLAFGLTMAVGRYESRRALVVQEANAIGTTFLRAQMLNEPARSASLNLLRRYADAAIVLADSVPDGTAFLAADGDMLSIQNELWALAGRAVVADPAGTVPRLYIETLNDMIDRHSDRDASLRNRVPSSVMILEVAGSAVALGMLSLYLALLGRGATTSVLAAAVVILILLVSFDLDRPARGFITIRDQPLVEVRELMNEPAAFPGP